MLVQCHPQSHIPPQLHLLKIQSSPDENQTKDYNYT